MFLLLGFFGGRGRSRMSARSSGPVPRRRSFGCGGRSDVAGRILRWRERTGLGTYLELLIPGNEILDEQVIQMYIYRQGLQAVPFSSRSHLQPAFLKDPDLTIIVPVVTSLFISCIERKPADSSGNCDAQEDFLVPLRRFLHGWTDMFWHELRCFADSSFTIETYDATVNTDKSDGHGD
ncbi:hypothetical protein AKJ16_DCAP18490 [Drosera capensis]